MGIGLKDGKSFYSVSKQELCFVNICMVSGKDDVLPINDVS